MYLVTHEYEEDGTWANDPEAFDSLDEARAWRNKRLPDKGCLFVIYRCYEIEV